MLVNLTGKSFKWNKSVEKKYVDIGGKLFKHSLSTLEFLLTKMRSVELDDLGSRSKIRVAQNIIRNSGDRTFELETQVTAVFNKLAEIRSAKGPEAEFTFSQDIARKSRRAARLNRENPLAVENVFSLLEAKGVVIDCSNGSRSKGKYKLTKKATVNHLHTVQKIVTESLFQVGNETM